MARTVNLALVGQTSVVREGLSQILSRGPFEIGCSSTCIEQLIAMGRPGHPLDLIVTDGSNLESIGSHVEDLVKHFPKARIALISDVFDFGTMVEAIRAGAHGFIIAENSCECLIESLRLIAMGERILPSQLADYLLLHPCDRPRASGEFRELNWSSREEDVIRCLVLGCPNKTIARKLDISEAAVKVHVRAVLRKIPAVNRTQAAIWAANRGLAAGMAQRLN